jgi:hypothetical protein
MQCDFEAFAMLCKAIEKELPREYHVIAKCLRKAIATLRKASVKRLRRDCRLIAKRL